SVLDSAGDRAHSIDTLLLAGASSCLPFVKDQLSTLFPDVPMVDLAKEDSLQPERRPSGPTGSVEWFVAAGAAIIANGLIGSPTTNTEVHDILRHDIILRQEGLSDDTILERGTPLPATVRCTRSLDQPLDVIVPFDPDAPNDTIRLARISATTQPAVGAIIKLTVDGDGLFSVAASTEGLDLKVDVSPRVTESEAAEIA